MVVQIARPPVSAQDVRTLLRGLNREQRRAVTHAEGPQLVLAGPGTGKTEVITRRVAWLIASGRARPREILALTFTSKAAAEMQSRVDLLVPYGQADAAIHTFHAFGDRLLREHAFELGLAGDVRLLGRAEVIVLLRDQLFSLGLERYLPLGDPTRFLGALVDLFWRAKDEGVLPGDFRRHADELRSLAAGSEAADREALLDRAAAQSELAAAYERYHALLGERGLIDHADQVLLALRLLREWPALRAEVQRRYRYILVDEFQDTNRAQLELVLALAGRSRNVTVVGDDDQAIYAFRGAAVSNVRRFVAAQSDVALVVLRRNYRSPAPIVEASQRLIVHNGAGRLVALAGLEKEPIVQRQGRRHAPVRLHIFRTVAEEADAVAAEVARRIAAGARPTDFAILVRTNADAEPFLNSLSLQGVPARGRPPSRLHSRPEVRPLLAFLRVVADPQRSTDLYALASAAPYDLPGDDLTLIVAHARRRHRSLWEVCSELHEQPALLRLRPATQRALRLLVEDVRWAIEQSHRRACGELLYDYLKRSGRLARLVATSKRDGEDPGALNDIVTFFNFVRAQASLLEEDRVAFLVPHLEGTDARQERAEEEDDLPNAVAVLTVHRAKGLEFPVVYLCGLSEDRFPARARPASLELPPELTSPSDAPADEEVLAEERRLCYVAMTRARDELVLSYSARAADGRPPRRASPFIAEALDRLPELSASAEPAIALPSPPRPAASPVPPRPAQPARPLSLSFSQLEDYFDCPERYRLRHVMGVPTPPHHSLVYGNALHQAVAAFHLRRARGDVMSEEELLAVFARHWSPEGFLSREHEEARYSSGQAALRRFRANELESGASRPSGIEKPFSFRVGRDEIRGRIDRLDETSEGALITDYKSADVRDQRKADQKARDSLQLQVYALASEATSGRSPKELRLHFLDSGVIGRARPEPARLERTLRRIEEAAGGIRAGSFPARPNPVSCGYCPYRAVCPQSAA